MTSEAIPSADFDRELGLDELLGAADRERLGTALAALLDGAVCLTDTRSRELLARGDSAGAARVALRGELEPIGWLESRASEARTAAAAVLLQMILRANARYLMASELHVLTVHEDYAELQRRHTALQASEARYRELAAHLEQRVAEQVQALEAAQRRLYQSEKLASVGQLAAGVAHEINNPIGFVASNLATAHDYVARLAGFAARLNDGEDATVLRQAWTEGDLDFILRDFADLIEESRAGTSRVAHIVADLKGFSRIDQAGDEDADVNALLRQVCNVAQGQLRGRAKVTLELGELPCLHCNAAGLGQVFLGLLLNAADATSPEGAVRIDTAHTGNEIRVAVRDNGRGIPADVLPRIFDPFFTTKGVGGGTGLGLTVCNDIVRAHGGRIEVDSVPGEGSTFTVCLPLK